MNNLNEAAKFILDVFWNVDGIEETKVGSSILFPLKVTKVILSFIYVIAFCVFPFFQNFM